MASAKVRGNFPATQAHVNKSEGIYVIFKGKMCVRHGGLLLMVDCKRFQLYQSTAVSSTL